ncbi:MULTISPECIES: sensor histidine kinase [unclassified Undibacterium]|uniref:sensor histidine kinase n=2 Tax=Undibacterium TaxID=401469 RepID=UPI002AC9B94C|nr:MULTISPECIES: sensor histidine kinase N-terminal domain-containing protein [unclassified Undibacterium]MEB0140535.1 sensor histidine kinase N-terminal domain-containing protein [Undibacterium sp. CCC2.1]MEB0171797.1 sensor histidine kinase N-terminal domain-containing protein [Undibacterium sp. CCC1.1]MEB0175613.1 sensor histidine kinase N-terminal domain-containing protein [Undibacterium sp. CCC3.4]MEB0216721.1 sensor histidine kinase N-terminal domain-containing protein [Undibacterium sp. 
MKLPPSVDPAAGVAGVENILLQPPEEKIQRSLFGEILDWMLAPLLLLWPMSIAITYLVAKSIANQPFDRALEDKVLVLSQQVKASESLTIGPLNKIARDILRADDLDNLFFQLRSNGTIIDGDKEIPLPDEEDKPANGGIQLRTFNLHGIDLRVAYAYVERRIGATHESQQILIQVGETLEKRAVLANEIIKGVVLPQFIILPVALALVWFALSRGLSPLAELQQRIRLRRPDDLSPIDARSVPEEITPLVTSLNDMLARVALTIDSQKRFIADAAHQMKTPLAGMRMQSELALRQTDQAEIHRSLLQLSTSSEAATRLINQLLTMARAENQSSASQARELINLNELAMHTVRDWIPASFAKKIDLGFEQPDFAINLFAYPVMLREMLSNLIDNAIRYTPSGHSVTVRVALNEEQALALLEVEDNGPGIVEAERERVFQRFYRILGSNVQGSGLGLAIVREIVQQHAAHIVISDNPNHQDSDFPGCTFRIAFPLKPFEDASERSS